MMPVLAFAVIYTLPASAYPLARHKAIVHLPTGTPDINAAALSAIAVTHNAAPDDVAVIAAKPLVAPHVQTVS